MPEIALVKDAGAAKPSSRPTRDDRLANWRTLQELAGITPPIPPA